MLRKCGIVVITLAYQARNIGSNPVACIMNEDMAGLAEMLRNIGCKEAHIVLLDGRTYDCGPDNQVFEGHNLGHP